MFNTIENDLICVKWYLTELINKQFIANKGIKSDCIDNGYFVDTCLNEFFGEKIVSDIGTLIERYKEISRYLISFKANNQCYTANIDVIQSDDINNVKLFVYKIVSVDLVNNLITDKDLINSIYKNISDKIHDVVYPFIDDKLLECNDGYCFDKEYHSIHINGFGNWPTKTFERVINQSLSSNDHFKVLYSKFNHITFEYQHFDFNCYKVVLQYWYDSADQQDVTVNSIRMNIPYIEKLPKQEN